MDTPYILTFGSFIRNGKYPLEADYIFTSEEDLKLWEENNRKYLHDGLFKIVIKDELQTLYWYRNNTFEPLITSDSLENISYLLKDFELHGQLRDLLRDILNNYTSKFKAMQQELDTTLAGAGLNGDGSFDELNMKNTTYLDGAKSIVEALKALDREISTLVVDSFILDAYYDTTTEEVVIVFKTKLEKEKTVRISMVNLIREWEPYNAPNKVVELIREEVYGNGADKVSADVRISSNKDNILEKEGNTLLVRGTSSNIFHQGNTVYSVLTSISNTLSSYADSIRNVRSAVLSITIKKLNTPEDGFSSTYLLFLEGNPIGDKINIPNNEIVKSITIKEVTTIDSPYLGAQIGDKYIEFAFYENADNFYIPTKDLVVNYLPGDGITIDLDNTIKVKVFTEDKYLETSPEGIKSKGIDEIISTKASIDSPIFTGIPMVETSPDPNDSSLRIPSTNWVKARISEIINLISPESEKFDKILSILKENSTLDQTKADLLSLGDEYKDLYSLASHFKAFLTDTDVSNTAINKWKEIEAFLQGITDTETLTGLLLNISKNLNDRITTVTGVEGLTPDWEGDFPTDSTLKQAIEYLLNNKINKEDGKLLSTNDYSNEDKEKLNSILNNATSDTAITEDELNYILT